MIDDHVTDDYAELRAALPDATPGQWFRTGPPWSDDGLMVLADAADPHVGHFIADTFTDPDDEGHENTAGSIANARYIAAANPSVIAALLADRDRLTEALEGTLRSAAHYECGCAGCVAARAALRGSGAAEEAGRG